MRSTRPAHTSIIGGLVLVLALAGAAGAEPPGSPDALSAAITALDSDVYAERERAMTALVEDRSLTDEHIASRLREEGLSAEQRTRLIGVLRERFDLTARGAIGVSFDPTAPEGIVRIRTAHREFPAAGAGLLVEGDDLIEVEGRRLERQGDWSHTLKSETCSRHAGETMRLRIGRMEGEERVEHDIVITLGDVRLFQTIKDVVARPGTIFSPSIRQEGFERRMERLGVDVEGRTMRTPSAPEAERKARSDATQGLARGARAPRLFSGPIDEKAITEIAMGRESVRRARLIAQLDRMRINNDANALPAELNLQGGAHAEFGRVRIRPEALEQQKQRRALAARRQRIDALVQARRREAIERLAAVRAERDRSKSVPATPLVRGDAGGDPVVAANRIARRIAELEAALAGQTRALRGNDAGDPAAQRIMEQRIAEFREDLDELRLRLEEAMAQAEIEGVGIEASVGPE